MRSEYEKDSNLQQKLQTILIHGEKLLFYVAPPFISRGMDLSVSTLLDALLYVKPTVEVVRLQFDGILFQNQ